MDYGVIIDKVAIPALLTVGAWLWSRVTKKKEEKSETRSLIDDIVENLIYELLDVYPLNVNVETYLKNSRGYIDKYIWTVAKKRGIPRNKTTERLANLAIERGTKLLAKEINNLRTIRSRIKVMTPEEIAQAMKSGMTTP